LCRAAALVHAQVLFHRNTTFAPAKFVIEAAAVCALEETAPGVAPPCNEAKIEAFWK
jgi:hypothetical protein